MTFPIQLAAIGAGVIFALYLIFKERNTARPLCYGSADLPNATYKPPSYDTHPLCARDKDIRREDCMICLSDIRDDNTPTRRLRCKHVFHADCIKTWLIEQRACPVCRKYA